MASFDSCHRALFVKGGRRVMGREAGFQSVGFRTDAPPNPNPFLVIPSLPILSQGLILRIPLNVQSSVVRSNLSFLTRPVTLLFIF